MNLTDLRQLMDERSLDPPAPAPLETQLEGVRRRVRAQRLRGSGWVAGSVAVLAGVAAALGSVLLDRPAPVNVGQPAPVQTIDSNGFPAYLVGTRILGSASGELPQTHIEVTVVPTGLDIYIFFRCNSPGEVSLRTDLTVNGHRYWAGGGCTGTLLENDWAGFDLEVGQPTTFGLTVTGADSIQPGGSSVELPVPRHGEFAFAIGVPVPFAEYPLPEPPAEPLPPLDSLSHCATNSPGCLLLESDPDDPMRPVTLATTWQPSKILTLAANTPGSLTVRVNGVEVAQYWWWDYGQLGQGGQLLRDLAPHDLDLAVGDPVTIEVIAEHMTGPWQVAIE